MYKYRPNKAEREAYGIKMREIEEFCKKNNITQSLSGDSYYFEINGIPYRVSNHKISNSCKTHFLENGETEKEFYHSNDDLNTVYITASKTRIIEIYNNLLAGEKLDKRGNVKND